MNVRKLRRLEVSSQLLLECLGPYPKDRTVDFVSDAIPKDAHIVQIHKRGDEKVEIILFSEEFPEFEGSIVPALVPVYQAAANKPLIPDEECLPRYFADEPVSQT